MNERQSSPEGQLVRIAHTLKEMGYKPRTKRYRRLIERTKLTFLDGQTISKALEKGQREKVLHELTDLANDSFS